MDEDWLSTAGGAHIAAAWVNVRKLEANHPEYYKQRCREIDGMIELFVVLNNDVLKADIYAELRKLSN